MNINFAPMGDCGWSLLIDPALVRCLHGGDLKKAARKVDMKVKTG